MIHTWTAEQIREVAREERIDVSDCTLVPICSAPTPLSREQIVDGLRMLASVPADTGERMFRAWTKRISNRELA